MNKHLLIPESIKHNNFDLIRFILASSVILCHCYAIYYGWDRFSKLEPFMKWSGGAISIGSAAVNFFFVISGFLIVRSFKYSSDFWDYIKKRILRIYRIPSTNPYFQISGHAISSMQKVRYEKRTKVYNGREMVVL